MLLLLETTLMYPAPHRTEGDWHPTWLAHEEANFASSDGTRIHGWYCAHPNPRAAVLLCHGNGEHVAFMAEEMSFLRDTFSVSVMAFDYRGYGKSSGRPFESGILADGEAAQRWLAKRAGLSANQIVLWGRSLGGAVAVHLAANEGARGLVLDRTFSSMVDVAASHYPWLPIRWALRNRYPSVDRIQAYTGPLMQVHGQSDQVVPLRFAERLFDAAPSLEKQLITSEDMTHNSPWPDAFYHSLDEFLDRLQPVVPQQ